MLVMSFWQLIKLINCKKLLPTSLYISPYKRIILINLIYGNYVFNWPNK